MISVIMPVYNVEKYLKRSIESVINQTYKHWELIIVNDGSTDNSLDICQLYANKDKRVKVFNQSNSGSGVARQNGLNRAIGDYICFIDPDDFIHENAFYHNITILLEYSPDLVVNGYFKYAKHSKGSPFVERQMHKLEGMFNKEEFISNFNEFEFVSPRALWNKLYRRDFLMRNNIKFSSQRTGQDAVFNYNVLKYINNIYIDKDSFYYYDMSREGSAVKKYNKNKFKYEMNIAKAYQEMFDSWGVSDIYSNNILYTYWLAVQNELINMTTSTSPLAYKDIKFKLKKILEHSDISTMFQNSNISVVKGSFAKFLYFMLKRNYTSIPILLMIIYNKYKLKY
ncbi:hypothetical protein CJ191_01935 [Aerococcus viridans]|uniref:Glycosyltransferase 2-like domain-containing protein n=1 Tax=Aerococcus viridans TaxID=1377 RepID=A0A2N6UFP5_9LACT|nr:glycosyltransferase family 2 protein [Aerococcus viridans]PMC80344.1 hypothetical protein CJ191_01935 [Aerococcus viridans]